MLSKKLLVFVFLIFSLFVGHIIFHHSGLSPKRDSNPEERKFRRSEYNLTEVNAKLSEKLKQATEKKIILYWTNNPGETIEGRTVAADCGNCQVTSKREKIDDAATKAIVFRYIDMHNNTFPKTRRLDQYYVWHNQESSSTIFAYKDVLKKYDDVFNLTMTYRQDSDIWAPYGNVRLSMEIISKLQKTDEYLDEMIRKKRKLALWIVSNCGMTPGAVERMKYVKSLRRDGLDIDVGGKCFPQGIKEWRTEDYKFYFAFENSEHCRDYVTEKYFENALRKEVVPVVFGPDKQDYELLGPRAAFVYAKDYSNENLIKLLNYLDHNDTAYKEYFKWRQIPLESLQEHRRAVSNCQLCRFIHGINCDSIFRTFPNPQKVALFYENLPERKVKSLSNWTFFEENSACLDGAQRFQTRIKNDLSPSFNVSYFFFLLISLIVFVHVIKRHKLLSRC